MQVFKENKPHLKRADLDTFNINEYSDIVGPNRTIPMLGYYCIDQLPG